MTGLSVVQITVITGIAMAVGFVLGLIIARIWSGKPLQQPSATNVTSRSPPKRQFGRRRPAPPRLR
jgi:hypothetical protein